MYIMLMTFIFTVFYYVLMKNGLDKFTGYFISMLIWLIGAFLLYKHCLVG